jgi:hypothetical protein
MSLLSMILVVFAFVLFAISAVWNPSPDTPWRARLVCAGLACWTLAEILSRAPAALPH